MKLKKNLTIVVEITGNGFSGYAKEIPGVYSAAATLSELKENITEVLELQELNTADYEVSYAVDLEQFFNHFSVINKSAFAENYAKVNQSLFRQYTKGLAPLSGDKLSSISRGLKQLAKEIDSLEFA